MNKVKMPVFQSPTETSNLTNVEFQSIIDNANGRAHIPAGYWTVTAPVKVNKPMIITGDGMYSTIITTMNGDFKIFDIDTPHSVTIKDLCIQDTGIAAPGSVGVYVQNSTGTYTTNFRADRLFINGTYDCIHMAECQMGTISNCFLYSPERYAIFNTDPSTPDGGDNSIYGNSILQYKNIKNSAAYRWESGGGVRFTNNKIVGGWDYGIWIEADDTVDPEVNTGDFIISNNSIEGCNVYSILVDTEGSNGLLHSIHITNNQIAPWSLTSKGIKIDSSGATIKDIIIANNIITDCGIETAACNVALINSNIFTVFGTPNIIYPINNSGGTNVTAANNIFSGYALDKHSIGTFSNTYTEGTIGIQGVNPGFWLDEIGSNIGAYCVLDQNIFQIQKRNVGFGEYLGSPLWLNMDTGNLNITGDIKANGISIKQLNERIAVLEKNK